MKVIPVIDILNGVAVHAVRGKRSMYQPLKSSLCSSGEPLKVACAFQKLGFTELYIADLDAITGVSANFEVFKSIASETGLELMVDAGVCNLETAEKLLQSGVAKVIIGTETLQSKTFIGETVKRFGSDRIIVSLDLKGAKVLVKLGFSGCKDPMCLLREFMEMGVLDVIVLDLTRVGSGEGVNVDFLKKVRRELSLNVYAGGGVRNFEDLVELKSLGVSGALVATALHSGKISVEELKQNGML